MYDRRRLFILIGSRSEAVGSRVFGVELRLCKTFRSGWLIKRVMVNNIPSAPARLASMTGWSRYLVVVDPISLPSVPILPSPGRSRRSRYHWMKGRWVKGLQYHSDLRRGVNVREGVGSWNCRRIWCDVCKLRWREDGVSRMLP